MKKKDRNDQVYTREQVVGKDPSKWMVLLNTVGLIVIMVATLIPLLNRGFDNNLYPYVYSAGAVMVLCARLFTPYTGTVMRMKRLHRLEAWSGIFFCVAAFFMFYEPQSNRDWLAFTLAGACVQIIATFMMTRQARKLLGK